jgi:hypothetical protein
MMMRLFNAAGIAQLGCPSARAVGFLIAFAEAGLGLMLLVGCHPEQSPEASVARILVPGLEIGDTFAPQRARLTALEFSARVGYIGELSDDGSPVGSVSIDADVSDQAPSRAPRVLGAFLLSKPGGASDLATRAEEAGGRAYGRPPQIGCSAGPRGEQGTVEYWRSRLGGVWIFLPSDSSRGATKVFIHGPALFYPSAAPLVRAAPCVDG